MGRKNKYTKEIKTKVVNEYIKGIKSYIEIANELNCGLSVVKRWVKMYKEYGEKVFEDKSHNKRYTKEFKEMVVKEYFEGRGSILGLSVKHEILSESTLTNWISKYKNGIILTDYKTFSEVYTMKSRDVTYEERIEIVNYCIVNDYDYKGTASKYHIPYSLVYNWTSKVKKNGYESLKLQKRGPKSKNKVELMTTEELLKIENERLKREIELLSLENEVLKKKHRLQKRANIQK